MYGYRKKGICPGKQKPGRLDEIYRKTLRNKLAKNVFRLAKNDVHSFY